MEQEVGVKRKRDSYEASFKLEVVAFAENQGNGAAERHFGISEANIRKWRKCKAELEQLPTSKKAMRFRETPYAVLEQELLEWINDMRPNVTRMGIRMKALQLCSKYDSLEFKASAGWCTRFMKRHSLDLQQKTHMEQALPQDVEERVLEFQKHDMIDQGETCVFSADCIGNMDEIQIFFNMAGSSSDDSSGSKTVNEKTADREKEHFTVVLSCLADGHKLEPMVILKRKTMPEVEIPPGIIVKVHPEGCLDERLTLQWVSGVWSKRPGGVSKQTLLVWDEFGGHLCETVKTALRSVNSRQAGIPEGCTSILQPLDVYLNKPFKEHVRQFWNEWVLNSDSSLMNRDELKRPDIALVFGWIVKSWGEISTDLVVKSFKKCGMSRVVLK